MPGSPGNRAPSWADVDKAAACEWVIDSPPALHNDSVTGAAGTVSASLVGSVRSPSVRPVRGTSPTATDIEEFRVTTPGLLTTRPPAPAEEEGLDALLELFGPPEAASTRPSLRATIARLQSWVQASSRRAAAWGAAPEHAGGAW